MMKPIVIIIDDDVVTIIVIITMAIFSRVELMIEERV